MKKMQEQSNFNEIKDMGGVEILTKIKILKLRIYRHKTILMKERVSGLLLKLKHSHQLLNVRGLNVRLRESLTLNTYTVWSLEDEITM